MHVLISTVVQGWPATSQIVDLMLVLRGSSAVETDASRSTEASRWSGDCCRACPEGAVSDPGWLPIAAARFASLRQRATIARVRM